jgi:PhnB protein
MTTPIIQPYLNFSGRCEEAVEFYKTALGAEVEMLLRFSESPEPSRMPLPDGHGDKIMHCSFRVGTSVLMASDGCGDQEEFQGISLSLTVADEAEARRVFEALAGGGKIVMPLEKTFWTSCFGMVGDRFGVTWMITIPHGES